MNLPLRLLLALRWLLVIGTGLAWALAPASANAEALRSNSQVEQSFPWHSSHHPTSVGATRVDRAPPATAQSRGTVDEADRWARGASACSQEVEVLDSTTYDDPTECAPIAHDVIEAHGQVSADIGRMPASADGGVAAKYGDDVADVAGDVCKVNSFTGDTTVLMADGTTKPIKDVALGDKVMATDPETGETGPRKVVDLIRHDGLHTMVAVRLSDGSTIDATDRHPFWVDSRGEWVDAIELEGGDEIVAADGRRIAVESVGVRAEDLTAYNLTVNGLHTYFVGVSQVLVHNAGCMSLGDALATKHGQERLAERGFDAVDIAIARSSNLAYEQADGAMAHVAQLDDLYNVVIVGERGVITGMKGLTRQELGNRARNYGWSGYP